MIIWNLFTNGQGEKVESLPYIRFTSVFGASKKFKQCCWFCLMSSIIEAPSLQYNINTVYCTILKSLMFECAPCSPKYVTLINALKFEIFTVVGLLLLFVFVIFSNLWPSNCPPKLLKLPFAYWMGLKPNWETLSLAQTIDTSFSSLVSLLPLKIVSRRTKLRN